MFHFIGDRELLPATHTCHALQSRFTIVIEQVCGMKVYCCLDLDQSTIVFR
jgi:hypothetical protein